MWPLEHPVLRHMLYLLPNFISTCSANTAFLPPFHRSHRRTIEGKTASTLASPTTQITTVVEELRRAFLNGRSRSIEWRRQQMRQLWAMLDENEAALQEALDQDIGKSKLEAQVYELGSLKNEIYHMLQHFEDWLEPETPVVPAMFHAYQPKIHKEPKGVVLIIAPWNYPIVLLLLPLLGAIAAGNCAILKPSQFVPKVTATLAGLIPKYLDRDCFRVVAGGKEVVEELLQHPLDHIFFTGSTSVGKSIMTKASRHPTPVTLELGGKCPAIVTESANVAQAAKRIAWGKFLNAGQTCVAPDYALVHESVLPGFLHELKQVMESTYAHDSEHPTKYGRIINTQHLNRLSALISSTKGSFLHSSGPLYPTDLSISPTVIRDTPLSDPLLQTEIFGPILPVVSYATLLSLPTMIRKIDPTPLATYIFTSHPQDTTYLSTHIHSGTSCVNDVMGHLGTTSLPVSGRGSSGFGAYRGKASIECFSATKTVVDVPTSEDFEGMLGFRYPGGDEELKYQMWKGMECKRDW